jgi:exonuclease III
VPAGNFDFFLHKLDYILNFYYEDNTEFIICGDINVNYLENNSKKAQLDEMRVNNNIDISSSVRLTIRPGLARTVLVF